MARKVWMVMVLATILLVPVSASDDEMIRSYQGVGNDYIRIEKPMPEIPSAMLIGGNQDSDFFSVTSYSEQGYLVDFLVNTLDPYIGVVPIDIGFDEPTVFLEIEAAGPWFIEIFPILAIPHLHTGETFTESGDALVLIHGDATMLSVTGNASRRHFSVIAYDVYGDYNGLLVNTTNQYSSRVPLPDNSLILRVSAVGSWSIRMD